LEENQLGHALGLTALVAALMTLLSIVSTGGTVGGFEYRRMDIFADVRVRPKVDSLALVVTDTAQVLAAPDTSALDSGQVQTLAPMAQPSEWGRIFEDYSFDGRGMRSFYAALDSIQSGGRKVRVAFYGDSFIEGDILLGDLRDTLQSVWGGGGVGFVPMDSEIARFRRTFLQQHIKGWRTYSILHNDGNPGPLGINGYSYVPSAEAQVRYDGTKQYGFRHTTTWGEVRLFYHAGQATSFVSQVEGTAPATTALAASTGPVSMWRYDAGAATIPAWACRFPQAAGLTVFGASLESGPGIYFDNFSTRGNSGGKLRQIRPEVIRAFDKHLQYDLVVLQYGLNAAGNTTRNIGWYRAELDKTFEHVRACFPNQPILIVSVPDRASNIDGTLQTLPSVPAIVQMQRELARKHGFLFFDFYTFMGGPGSMIELANRRSPRLANTDYTHLTHEGGRYMGLRFAQIWIQERKSVNE
jgi:lysophospholipase L1-like esterase